jgi:hypothetical protein
VPKQLWKIDQFHGGLNSSSDPRDIADSQLSTATDVMVDELGKIRTMGGTSAHVSGTPEDDQATGWYGTLVPGYGLFQFSHDRLGAEDMGSAEVETGDDYLALYDGNDGQVWIYSKERDVWDDIDGTADTGVIDIGSSSTSSAELAFYNVDGSLRVSDGNFNNTNQWYGYIKRTLFPSTTPTVANDGWFSEVQGLTAPPSGDILTNGNDPPAANGEIECAFFDATGTGGTWDEVSYDGVALYVTFVYDGDVGDRSGQESLPFKLSTIHPTIAADKLMKLAIIADPPFNPRITGGRIYWSEVLEVDVTPDLIDGTRYLLAEFDFNRGCRGAGEEDWKAWGDGISGDVEAPDGEYLRFLTPPTAETYDSINGFSSQWDSISFDNSGDGFKTAVVVNRMVYAGNVRMTNKDGVQTTFGDAMIKSIQHKFDTFIPNNIVEVTIRDGDEIVKLEEYADRILQFKKHKMHLLNISQEIEILEDTFINKGVSHPAATCKTDFGIAWVNKHGVYLYNGEKVINLLEKGGMQIIKESDWETFTANEPMIGYIPKKRQLIIVDDITSDGDGSIFLYDLVTQSWVKGAAATFTVGSKTNFITDWNGDLVHSHTSGTMLKWDDASATSTLVDFRTKDIDFGQPSQRKKIYKIYVTHRGSASNIQTAYAVDGNAGTFTNAGSELPATSPVTDWVTTEVAISVANCYSLQLKFFSNGTTPTNFEINDISIVYRSKHIK